MLKQVLVSPRVPAAGLLPALLLAAVPAAAQVAPLISGMQTLSPEATTPDRLSASQRVAAEYAPLGARVGDFLVYPSVALQELYNSNIFVTETGQKSDLATFLEPALTAVSDWNTNALDFLASGDIRRYYTQVSENESNFNVATTGRYDILTGVYLTGALGYQLGHEDRTSPDTTVNQKVPTEFQLVSGRLGYAHDVGIVGFDLDGGIDYYTYNNNVTATGIPIVETDRNRVEYGLTPRVTYEIVPGYHAFIQAPLNMREYQAQFDVGGFNRSSKGFEVDAGTAFEVTALVNGEAYVGYQQQDYDDAHLAQASGPAFGGNLLWNPTVFTSVKLAVARTIQETDIDPASSYIQSYVGLTLEHTLLRNLLLTAGVAYLDQDYQGLSRDDDIYSGSVGARYLINEYLSASLSAIYQVRLSNVSPNSYRQETVLAGIKLQY